MAHGDDDDDDDDDNDDDEIHDNSYINVERDCSRVNQHKLRTISL